jgi:hypothetical protein
MLILRRRSKVGIKLVPKKKQSNPITHYENLVLELDNIQAQKKLIEEREDYLKDELKKYVTDKIDPDEKEHRNFFVIRKNGQPIHFQLQCRKKVSLNQERALRFFRKSRDQKLRDVIVEKKIIASEVTEDQLIEALEQVADEYLDTVEIIDEEYLEQLIVDQTLSMKTFESLCDVDKTFIPLIVRDRRKKGES